MDSIYCKNWEVEEDRQNNRNFLNTLEHSRWWSTWNPLSFNVSGLCCPVRFRSAAWLWDARNVDFSMFLAFFVIKYFDYTFISPAEIVKNNEQGIFCYWLVGLLMRTKCICCDLRNWKASSIFALLTNLSSIVFDGTSSIIMIMSA